MKFEIAKIVQIVFFGLLVSAVPSKAQTPECKFLKQLLVDRWNYSKKFKKDKVLHKKLVFSSPNAEYFSEFFDLGSGKTSYNKLDIDMDGKQDEVVSSCGSGDGLYANGCSLHVKMSSGVEYEKNDLGALTIVEYMGSTYVLSRWDRDPTKTKIFVDKIMNTNIKRICE